MERSATGLDKGPTNVERWSQGLATGIKRWKGIEQRRAGLGDAFYVGNNCIVEMSYTMREIKVRTKLPKTHHQRAIQFGLANPARDPHSASQGWVELTIDSDSRLQDALSLARQAYMETQR